MPDIEKIAPLRFALVVDETPPLIIAAFALRDDAEAVAVALRHSWEDLSVQRLAEPL